MRDRNIYLIILAFIIIGPFLQPRVMVTEMLIFGIVAVASNIMIGYTGMLSFGQAMFFGIGAYEARQLAIAMGGTLDVVSREGEGTRFRLTLAAETRTGQSVEQAA